MSRGFFWVLAGVAALVMGGCSAVPGTGPSAGAVIHNASVTSAANSTNSQADPLSYALVDINRDTVRRLSIPETFRGVFRSSQRAPAIYIGRGDRVDVTIFEAQAGGLFIPADSTLSQGNFVRLPTQEVGSDGSITVPYVGSVRATGRTPAAIENEIESLLANRAIEPQAVVSVSQRESNLVTVTGTVKEPGLVPINQNGTRVLDAISAAGGATYLDFETLVTLHRGSRKATMRLSDLIADGEANVILLPRDTVSLQRDQRFFSILGATNVENQRIPFDKLTVTLAEGIALGGGLADDRADPLHVFIFRQENKNTLRDLEVDVDRFTGSVVPTAYHLDMRAGDGLLLAQLFQLKSGDVIYLTTHPTTDFLKANAILLNILSSSNGTKALVY